MIVIPLIPKNLTNYRLDSLILYSMTNSSEPLSIQQITTKLKEINPSGKYHLRSVRRCVQALCADGIVTKKRLKDKGHRFSVERGVLEKGVKHIQTYLEKKA